MFDGTVEQHFQVYGAICANKRLSDEARTVFLACLLRLYAVKTTLPIPRLPLPIDLPEKGRFRAANELCLAKLAEKVRKVDGWHLEIPKSLPLFVSTVKPMGLEGYNPSTSADITTFQLAEAWGELYRELFRTEPKKDPKDLVRFRFVLRKQGGQRALQAIHQFLEERRNAPHKATTLGFYAAYGKSK